MNKAIFRHIFSFLVFISTFSFGSENNQPASSSTKKTSSQEFIFSQATGGPHTPIKNLLTTAKLGDKIKLAQLCLTDPDMQKKLGSTKAEVEIILDSTTRNKAAAKRIQELNPKAKIFLSKNMPIHSKTIIAELASSTPETSPEKKVVIGSRNMSGHAYHNQEMVEVLNNEKGAYEELNASFDEIKKHSVQYGSDKSPEKKEFNYSEKMIVPSTPQKITVLNSLKHKLNETRAARLTGEDVYIATMNLTDDVLVNKIKTESKQGTKFQIILNNPKSDKQKEVLKDLAQHDNVNISIYNEGDTIKHGVMPSIMHDKVILRKKGQTYLSIISTGNCTTENDNEFNHDCYTPLAKNDYENILKDITHLQSRCTKYIAPVEVEEKTPPSTPSPKKTAAKRKFSEISDIAESSNSNHTAKKLKF